MSELAIVAIVFLAISLVIYVVVNLYNQHVAAKAGPRQWTVNERTTIYANGASVQVELVRGHDRIPIGPAIACDTSDFDDRLLDARVRAEDRATILNRRLSP